MPSWRLNDVPIAMYLAHERYGKTYASMRVDEHAQKAVRPRARLLLLP